MYWKCIVFQPAIYLAFYHYLTCLASNMSSNGFSNCLNCLLGPDNRGKLLTGVCGKFKLWYYDLLGTIGIWKSNKSLVYSIPNPVKLKQLLSKTTSRAEQGYCQLGPRILLPLLGNILTSWGTHPSPGVTANLIFLEVYKHWKRINT